MILSQTHVMINFKIGTKKVDGFPHSNYATMAKLKNNNIYFDIWQEWYSYHDIQKSMKLMGGKHQTKMYRTDNLYIIGYCSLYRVSVIMRYVEVKIVHATEKCVI